MKKRSITAMIATCGLALSTLTAQAAQVPISFESNQGQTNRQVQFLARSNDFNLFLTAKGALLVPHSVQAKPVHLEWLGARPASAVGKQPLVYKSHYLIGPDPTHWQRDIPHYNRVRYSNLYPGIDLVWYSHKGSFEYDLQLAPGANLEQVRLEITGSQPLHISPQGDLLVSTPAGTLSQARPLVYQWIDGKRQRVEGRYVQRGPQQVGFSVGRHDFKRPLVIDPVVSYFTYLGGSGNEDAQGVAVDREGAAYVTGHTTSLNFPTSTGANAGLTDIYVTKFDPTGTQALYSTYLGGSGDDFGVALAVDPKGNAYVRGSSASSDYPITSGAAQSTFGGGASDAVITKLNAQGDTLLYSTYLGGSEAEGFSFTKRSIAVDRFGNAYFSGDTASTNFPITSGAFRTSYGGGPRDGFVAKLNATGTAFLYATYLPGNDDDGANSIAIDTRGNAYVAGFTSSSNFPTTAGAYQNAFGGAVDAFALKLDPSGSNAVYATYLGGSGADGAGGLALDRMGNVALIGATGPGGTNFPITPEVLQGSYGGGNQDIFVAKLNEAGSKLLFSTYLGGSGRDFGADIALDRRGCIYVVSGTSSPNYPVSSDAFQPLFGGGTQDAALSVLDPTGRRLLYSTYFGGPNADNADGVAVDRFANSYVTWTTESEGLPTTAHAFQPILGGGRDAALTKLTALECDE
jgi:Beta-propeller repeat